MIRIQAMKERQSPANPIHQEQAEDLADKIGPISTRADRIRIIRAWLENERRKSLPPIDIAELLFGDV